MRGNVPYRRFTTHAAASPDAIGLPADHPALVLGKTLFPGSVSSVDALPSVIKSGVNQRKLGSRVMKGDWRGMPLFSITLEERATCPTSCHHWATCYGNGMPFAARAQVDDKLLLWIDAELDELDHRHPGGFVVRLHILGDFFSVGYVARWGRWLRAYTALHVFGYTAWPETSPIGRTLDLLVEAEPRFRIRRSVPIDQHTGPGQVFTVTSAQAAPAIAIVCPASTDATACCGTCGLCWADAAWHRPIAFPLHGRQRAPGRRHYKTIPGGMKAMQPRLLEMIAKAAAAGRQAPTNVEIQQDLRLDTFNLASRLVATAERDNLIKVERFARDRIITILATGARTATPNNTTPHWLVKRGKMKG